jgi:hypothetical protein
MKKLLGLFLMVGFVACLPCGARAAEEGKPAETVKTEEPKSVLHKVAMYIPNRILDVLDIARLRLRVGPGVAVEARATKVVSAFVGSYASVYAGLPGPRNRPTPKLPIGVESLSGIQASLADATVSGEVGPDYGPTEVGVGVQALIVGFDVGIEPLEIVDLVTGLFFIDIRGDDL